MFTRWTDSANIGAGQPGLYGDLQTGFEPIKFLETRSVWVSHVIKYNTIQIHYTTLHYTTLHYTTLHYTTLHYTTLHYTTLHYTTLHYTTLHYTTLHYTTLHYTTLHYTTLHYTTLHYNTIQYNTIFCFEEVIISKMCSHKLMPPLGALVSCSLMLACSCKKIASIKEQSISIFVALYLSKEFQAFCNCRQFEPEHMYSFFNLT